MLMKLVKYNIFLVYFTDNHFYSAEVFATFNDREEVLSRSAYYNETG